MIRARSAGPALALFYVAVAVGTSALTAGRRPLFDGFAPPVPYNWSKPPPEFAAGNFPPRAGSQSVALTAGGSEPVNASTEDAQAILTLPAGAVRGDPTESGIEVRLTPLDASTLAPPPPDLKVVSNAYLVAITYAPSQAPLNELASLAPPASPATIALTAATPGDTLLFSVDGRGWQTVPSRPFGNTNGLVAPLRSPGYYVVAASPAVHAPSATVVPPGGGGSSPAAMAGAAAAAVVVIFVAAVGTGARGRRRSTRSRKKRRGNTARRR